MIQPLALHNALKRTVCKTSTAAWQHQKCTKDAVLVIQGSLWKHQRIRINKQCQRDNMEDTTTKVYRFLKKRPSHQGLEKFTLPQLYTKVQWPYTIVAEAANVSNQLPTWDHTGESESEWVTPGTSCFCVNNQHKLPRNMKCVRCLLEGEKGKAQTASLQLMKKNPKSVEVCGMCYVTVLCDK